MKRSEPLTAEELSAMRCSKAHPRSLPVMPPKGFVPDHSEAEKECILGLVQTELSYLKEERAEKKSMLSVAEWDADNGLAIVKHKTGSGWDVYGFEEGGSSYLLPEEALFLLELSRLELWFSGIPVSVKHAYQLLLKEENECNLNYYKVFAHLNRLGYRLIKVDPKESVEIKRESAWSTSDEPLRKRAKLDGPPMHRKPGGAKAAQERQRFFQLNTNTIKFYPFAATVADLDVIPNFAGKENTLNIIFEPDLVPEGIENRLSSYVIDKSKFQFIKDDDVNLGLPAPRPPRPKTWEEFDKRTSSIFEFNRENHPLYQGAIKPLLNGDFSGDVLSKLDIVGSAVNESESDDEEDDDLPICYSVYSPDRRFKKTDPGPPCYYLAIATKNAAVPKSSSLAGMKRACPSGTRALIAITGAGSGVSFIELKDVMTPFQP